ncbi:MAG: alpha-amylase family glycosyl hydrolase [Phycisphaerales bacterium JB039]
MRRLVGYVLWASITPVAGARGGDWWRDAVFYEVFVRSFADSTAGPLADDGVGDLPGLIERLDYLNDGDPATDTDLGVTALWLMPIMPSPSYHGYDVTDYKAVQAQYGTLEDFRRLIEACEARGMRVIVDLPLNHTSDRHPWFEAARAPGAPTADWYVFSDDPARTDVGERVWHDRGMPEGRWYYGLFWHGMPDLNLRTQAVTEALYDASAFWLTDMGAHGFRLDAIRHLIEDWPVTANTPETIAWLEDYRQYIESIAPEAVLVGEVWNETDVVRRYVPGAVNACFEFALARAILDAARSGEAAPLGAQIEQVASAYPPGAFATFLANHDMNRTVSQLEGDLGAARAAATVQMLLPGTPFVYYGEEIGMTAVKPDPDLRRPMQWTSEAGRAGFTRAEPWRPAPADIGAACVAAQMDDPDSLLELYRRLIRLRLGSEALRRGDVRVLDAGHPAVLAILREAPGERVLALVNLGAEAVEEYAISARPGWAPGARDLLAGEPVAPIAAAGAHGWRPVARLAPRGGWVIPLGP